MTKFEVKTQTGRSFLLKDEDEIHRGGEGRIILMPPKTGLVAKIYHPGIKTIGMQQYNALKVLPEKYFVKPMDLLYQNNQIVGYSMEYAGKEFFPLSALFSQQFILRNGLDDKYKELIANKITEAVKLAHNQGFVIGDLNQYNILVNLKGEVKFIDVDSYQAPGEKHSGVLLDDIRDYYYQGMVSQNSDYFALSVLLFSLLTYIHPFKGIHQKYKSLADRMIHKIPVYLDDPLLKVPKCYKSITQPDLQSDFDKIYLRGYRFLLSINNYYAAKTFNKPAMIQSLDLENVSLKEIYSAKSIMNVNFNPFFGSIETSEVFILFRSMAKGNLERICELDKKEFSYVFPGNRNLLALRDRDFYCIDEKGSLKKINNFQLPDESRIHQAGNILIILTQAQMYWVYIDEVLNNSIRNKRSEVFSGSFNLHSGLIQNTGGVQRIFYNTGKDIASVKTSRDIKRIFQSGNTGLLQYVENGKTENCYFRINGLSIEYSQDKPDGFFEFASFIPEKGQGYIFEPGEGKILIRRDSDFEIVSEISCDLVHTGSPLFYSGSGIIVWENQQVYLINQK
jgi:serine/threonine protein kinase